jgi:hypothetical protein
VNENFSSVSITFDLNTLSSLTTVCGMSSRFVHVTVVPAGTVTVAGPKLKLSIFTSVFDAGGCPALATELREAPPIKATAAIPIAITTKLHTPLLMTIHPFYFFSVEIRRAAF